MGDDYKFSNDELEEVDKPQINVAETTAPRLLSLSASSALEKAKRGDWRELEKRVRSDTLKTTERAFVADILAGKIKRPSHNPPDFEAQRRWRRIADYVVWGETQSIRKKPLIADAARVFGVGRSAVYEALRRRGKRAEGLRDFLLRSRRVSELISRFYWKPGERVPEDRRDV